MGTDSFPEEYSIQFKVIYWLWWVVKPVVPEISLK